MTNLKLKLKAFLLSQQFLLASYRWFNSTRPFLPLTPYLTLSLSPPSILSFPLASSSTLLAQLRSFQKQEFLISSSDSRSVHFVAYAFHFSLHLPTCCLISYPLLLLPSFPLAVTWSARLPARNGHKTIALSPSAAPFHQSIQKLVLPSSPPKCLLPLRMVPV